MGEAHPSSDVSLLVIPGFSVAARTALSGPSRLSASVGGLALAIGVAHVIALPAGLLPVVLAAIAAWGLGRSRLLGPLGGAMVVVLAIPFGRGADVDVLLIAGVPVRPGDAAIIVGLLATLPLLRRPRLEDRAVLAALAAFLAAGVLSLGVGLLSDHALRDVFRDARWWGLYAALGFALLARVPSANLLRALDLGAIAFAGVAILAVALPVFDGGLKEQALVYDRGTLRMQFGNTVFLLPAIARAVDALIARPRPAVVVALATLVIALMLSLTRTTVLVTLGMCLLTIAFGVLASRVSVASRVRATGLTFATLAVAVVIGVTLSQLATVTARSQVMGAQGGSTQTPSLGSGESPLDRITFQSDASDVETTIAAANGRMTTYRNAFAVITRSPVLGAGMGSLVDVPFAYSDERAHTALKQPGVDNAYLTVGLKAGVVGILTFGILLLVPLLMALRMPGLRRWFIPAWGAILGLGMTQSFAVSGYAPFMLALLAAIVAVGYASRSGSTAFSQR